MTSHTSTDSDAGNSAGVAGAGAGAGVDVDIDVYTCKNCGESCVESSTATFQYSVPVENGGVRWKKQSYTTWTHVESGIEKCGGERSLHANPGEPRKGRTQ